MESRYIATDNNELVDKESGEIIKFDDIKKAKKKKLVDEVQEINEELQELGLNSAMVICEYKGETYNCIKIKPNFQFDKMFRTSMQDVIKDENLSMISKALLLTIMPFITFPSNVVKIKECNTLEDIGELAGLKPSTMYKAMKELIDKQIIYKKRFGGKTEIFVNPFLISSGVIVEKYTFELFKDSKYNPVH